MRYQPKEEGLLLKAAIGAVSLLVVSFISWATWTTTAIFEIKSDLKAIKVANHLAVRSPDFGLEKHPPSVMANPNFAESLLGFFTRKESQPIGSHETKNSEN